MCRRRPHFGNRLEGGVPACGEHSPALGGKCRAVAYATATFRSRCARFWSCASRIRATWALHTQTGGSVRQRVRPGFGENRARRETSPVIAFTTRGAWSRAIPLATFRSRLARAGQRCRLLRRAATWASGGHVAEAVRMGSQPDVSPMTALVAQRKTVDRSGELLRFVRSTGGISSAQRARIAPTEQRSTPRRSHHAAAVISPQSGGAAAAGMAPPASGHAARRGRSGFTCIPGSCRSRRAPGMRCSSGFRSPALARRPSYGQSIDNPFVHHVPGSFTLSLT